MADKTWKAVERRIAKYGCGERVPVTGRQRGSAPDITWAGDLWSFEVKHRKSVPAWIHDAMDQAEKSATENTPVVVLHENGQLIEDCFCVLRLRDLRAINTALLLQSEMVKLIP